MRPRPLTIVLLLLAGAAVNVAVAWGWAYSRPPTTRWGAPGIGQFYLPEEDDASMWIDNPPPEYGELPKSFKQYSRLGRTLVIMSSAWVREGNSGTICTLEVVRTGFPFRTFEGGTWAVCGYVSASVDPMTIREGVDGALVVGPNDAVIPTSPATAAVGGPA